MATGVPVRSAERVFVLLHWTATCIMSDLFLTTERHTTSFRLKVHSDSQCSFKTVRMEAESFTETKLLTGFVIEININTYDVNLGGARFESRQRHRLS